MKKKPLGLLVLLGIIAGIGFGYFITHVTKATKNESSAILALQQKQLPTTTSPGVPTSIIIPKIKVQATVESVGMDSQGRMDVPKTADDTAWYSPGYKPGTQGSAVIDGHLDRVTGAPAVFWNLKELSVGDQIIVSENNGKTYTFAVDRKMRYSYTNFPIKEVFGASQTPMLNLITCNGVWDKNSKNYSDRLVVYSKLVSQK